jgi:hypothetical protein
MFYLLVDYFSSIVFLQGGEKLPSQQKTICEEVEIHKVYAKHLWE